MLDDGGGFTPAEVVGPSEYMGILNESGNYRGRQDLGRPPRSWRLPRSCETMVTEIRLWELPTTATERRASLNLNESCPAGTVIVRAGACMSFMSTSVPAGGAGCCRVCPGRHRRPVQAVVAVRRLPRDQPQPADAVLADDLRRSRARVADLQAWTTAGVGRRAGAVPAAALLNRWR